MRSSHRAWTLLLTVLAVPWAACQGSKTTSDAVPPETATSPRTTADPPRPITTNPSGPAKIDPGVDTCVAACVRARQMEAVSIEVIESTCRERCSADPNAYPP